MVCHIVKNTLVPEEKMINFMGPMWIECGDTLTLLSSQSILLLFPKIVLVFLWLFHSYIFQ